MVFMTATFTEVHVLAAAQEHDVTPNGINCEDEDAREAWVNHTWGLADQLDQVNRAAELMRGAPRSKTQHTAVGSYTLKHRLERVSPGGYISNGATIVAACLLDLKGWSITRPKYPDIPKGKQERTLNAFIGISKAHDFDPVRQLEAKCAFTTFVRRKRHSLGMLGEDFANDWLSEWECLARRREQPAPVESLDQLVSHLIRKNACLEAIEAAEHVWRRFDRSGARLRRRN